MNSRVKRIRANYELSCQYGRDLVRPTNSKWKRYEIDKWREKETIHRIFFYYCLLTFFLSSFPSFCLFIVFVYNKMNMLEDSRTKTSNPVAMSFYVSILAICSNIVWYLTPWIFSYFVLSFSCATLTTFFPPFFSIFLDWLLAVIIACG